jgi:hypothetical protein
MLQDGANLPVGCRERDHPDLLPGRNDVHHDRHRHHGHVRVLSDGTDLPAQCHDERRPDVLRGGSNLRAHDNQRHDVRVLPADAAVRTRHEPSVLPGGRHLLRRHLL